MNSLHQETYKFITLDNDDILLQKVIIDNKKYTIINKENGDILLKKNIYINITDINDIKNYDFKKSIIYECIIDKKQFNNLKYNSILKHVYNKINDGIKIIKNTLINIKTIKKNDEGFYYLNNLGISFQGIDSNRCLLEIINHCIENKIKLSMKIKLIDEIIINLSF